MAKRSTQRDTKVARSSRKAAAHARTAKKSPSANKKSASLQKHPTGTGWWRPSIRPTVRWGTRLAVVALLALTGLTAWLDLKVRAEFEGKKWAVPARVYARPLAVFEGQQVGREQLIAELKASRYRQVRSPSRPGEFSASSARVNVVTRDFKFWDGQEASQQVSVSFEGARVSRVASAGRPADLVRFEPALIARIYPSHREDRVLKKLDELPPELVAGLVVVEDRHFFEHFGISFRGIARAALANLMAGGAVQGGSTLTQQLAKNFFLSSERTLWRKVREALIALILEARYDKETILAAYLNEIFLGQHGRNAVHGFGSAAQFYFGRPVNELAVHESALLIALARGASYYNPRRFPDRAKARRDLVLDVMAERGVISAARAVSAKRLSLGVSKRAGPASSAHPAFLELVRKQLKRDYQESDLKSEGLRIFTTLEPSTQRAAEHALNARLQKLESARKLPKRRLQGAVVVVEPDKGDVVAVVGDRSPRAHGFNRALNARRPIGSLIKPAVVLTALENHYSLDTPVKDAPIALRLVNGKTWRPQNYDKKFYGDVTVEEALARSLNLATVRLGLDLGVDRIAAKLRELGVEQNIPNVPSLLLGTLELTPLEVAALYQPIANGGFKMPLRAIREVTAANGRPLARYPLRLRQVADAKATSDLHKALMSVVSSGTAQHAKRTLPKHLHLAGKTGTTDDLRDSWYAGFGAKRLSVVWVGRDDNKPAKLTGSSGALQVWADLALAIPPKSLNAHAAQVSLASAEKRVLTGEQGGCAQDLLGGFIEKLLGSGCKNTADESWAQTIGSDR